MNTDSADSTKELLRSIGLPDDLLESLLDENDWSFIIKLHALFEAVLASAIVKKLNAPSIEEAVSQLDFSGAKCGKVTFAQSLQVIGAREASFLRGLSELRNRLVHNVRNVSFSIKEYVEALDANQRKAFRKQFGHALLGLENGEADFQRCLAAYPRLIVYFAAWSCLLSVEFNLSERRMNMLIELLRESAEG